ncbi:alpha/beta hydrolase [Acaricomes phytoseiuli]|uniref:alpha/beta hydrolase n=1 Tax=Acaricomes phytoseiuli TaxID=291968 RepID=UPI0022235614|nr:alpha/beta hydrolase [Acaricomes phytoseiuli]MCW1250619.1 alpha/beta hydrolase [Acaricomes phytoseiuli]
MRSRPALRRSLKALALTTAAGLALSGCMASSPESSQTSSPNPAAQQAPPELQRFYEQSVQWNSCERDMLCTTVNVPVDYSAPEGETIDLALIKLPAGGNSQGPVVVNPGGPGGSGYDLVSQNATQQFSQDLRNAYDIVGFDPRGVKRSSPVTCISDEERDRDRQKEFDLDTDAGYAAAQEEVQKFADACQQNTGPVLEFTDTNSAARDMDVIRAVLGSETLDYLGFSYGTFLGARYAGLFPERVGKFVLDAAIDPSLSVEDLALGQAKGFEAALRTWTENCLSGSNCPVRGSVDEAMQQIRDLNESYRSSPKATSDGRLLTGSGFSSALSLAMYSTDLWPVLQRALSQAIGGDPNGMMTLADFAADRDPQTGEYNSNSVFAFTAINCLDYPMSNDQATLRAESQRLQEASPTFGKYLSYSGLACGAWPYQASTEREPIAAEGAAPIVVIGTTGDPATPYEWSVALRDQLSSGVLVTREGEGHTAYGKGNQCIQRAVDNYFIDGTVPEDNLRCS